MTKIRIRNFGPIKGGYQENDGWIEIEKVTVLIGNQGSGKSTLAKVIATMMWLEKAMHRGDEEAPDTLAKLMRYFEYQGLKNYFRENSFIEYSGVSFNIKFDKETTFPIVSSVTGQQYLMPKIMYVPAERNFLSTIKNAYDVKGLPGPLFTFAEELRRTQLELEGKEVDLPIGDYKYQFEESTDRSVLIGADHVINLLESSIGFQSVVPLFLVSRNLSLLANERNDLDTGNLSVKQSTRIIKELSDIFRDKKLSDAEKTERTNIVRSAFINKAFINIVEEPEQNLFPSSQWEVLKSLLAFNNHSSGNRLLITTHSPYIINFLSIAIQGHELKEKIEQSGNKDSLSSRLNEIVPETSLVAAAEAVVYQLNEKDGSIRKLLAPEGIPSDRNYLNDVLREGNNMFDSLLEIEEEL